MISTKLQLRNKIHTAAVPGTQGELRDQNDRWAATLCGTRSAQTRPHYVANDREVTCTKCQ
jgi:hypothetical protein